MGGINFLPFLSPKSQNTLTNRRKISFKWIYKSPGKNIDWEEGARNTEIPRVTHRREPKIKKQRATTLGYQNSQQQGGTTTLVVFY